ncbi:DUF2690 domain-containing protein [Streptomyces sp. NPDC052727]|uniref:helix-turn-helix domain-containing protein n=1 Tax=Streptomyces sp. NPDC052727 TaxID=3154854 RepID=UPI00341671FC
MPRWKALPEDLDPQIKEFTVQLRQLADRGGLNTTALADRTGYGKTSWERYLGGRLLAPKGAVIALAEATGTDPGPLTTLWELAERSWTRAESNDDHTIQALTMTESRAALGDLARPTEETGHVSGGSPAVSAGGAGGGRSGGSAGRAVGRESAGAIGGAAGSRSAVSAGGAAGVRSAGPAGGAVGSKSVGAAGSTSVGTAGGAADRKGGEKGAGPGAGRGGGLTALLGTAGPARVSPTIPAQPTDSEAGIRDSVPNSTGLGGEGGGDSGEGSVTAGASGRGTAAGAGSGADSGAGSGAGGGGGPDTGGGRGSGAAAGAGSGVAVGGGSGALSRADSRTASGIDDPPVKNSWGLAGYRGPSKASVRPGTRPGPAPTPPSSASSPDTPARTPGLPAGAPGASARFPDVPGGGPSTSAWPRGLTVGTPAVSPRTQGRAAGTRATPAHTPGAFGGAAGTQSVAPLSRRSEHRQQVLMFLAGLVGVGVLIAGVLLFTQGDGGKGGRAVTSPSPSAPARTSPPPGVKCTGAACTGKDAEAMGCSGDLVSTAKTATVGSTTLEVRYSKACGTAWGRITSGAPGDTVRVTVGKVRQTGDITAVADTIGYTPMVAVHDPAQARACATLASGETGCTR